MRHYTEGAKKAYDRKRGEAERKKKNNVESEKQRPSTRHLFYYSKKNKKNIGNAQLRMEVAPTLAVLVSDVFGDEFEVRVAMHLVTVPNHAIQKCESPHLRGVPGVPGVHGFLPRNFIGTQPKEGAPCSIFTQIRVVGSPSHFKIFRMRFPTAFVDVDSIMATI
jgi:hypothetical protein